MAPLHLVDHRNGPDTTCQLAERQNLLVTFQKSNYCERKKSMRAFGRKKYHFKGRTPFMDFLQITEEVLSTQDPTLF